MRTLMTRWLAGAGFVLAGLVLACPAGTDAPPAPQPARQAVGGLAAVNVYSLHGSIGLAADAYRGELYDAERTGLILADVRKVLAYSITLLEKLQPDQPMLSPKVRTASMIELYRQIDREAKLLEQYLAADPDDRPALLKRYTGLRETNWQRLRNLLGLQTPQDEQEDKP